MNPITLITIITIIITAWAPGYLISTVRHGFLAQNRFGFYASTDTHDGYPGHYGHDRVGALAEKLDRASLWKAIWNRHIVASTDPNSNVKCRLDKEQFGDVIAYSPKCKETLMSREQRLLADPESSKDTEYNSR